MKISYLILLSFILILLMFSFTTYINFRQAEKVNENSEWLAASTLIVREGGRFQRNILNMISGLRGYLFTGENYFLQSYDSSALENETILREISSLASPDSIRQKSLNEIRALHDTWIAEFSDPLKKAKQMSDASDSSRAAFNKLYAEKAVREQILTRRLLQKFRDFHNYEYALRENRQLALDQSITQTRNISFYLTTVSIVTGFFIAVFIARRISNRIMNMVRMSQEIAAGNYSASMEDSGRDELSGLSRSLNHMAKVLDENISMLKRKNEELDQFAHIVSHDLKAPLRGIDNVITWIEEDHSSELSPKLKEYIQHIKNRLIRAENLIRGILSYARVGKDEQEKEEVDLNQMIDDIKENISMRSGLRLQVQQKLPVLFTEKLPLEQVFSNLIMNAIKYHDKSEGEIRLYYTEENSHLEFYVEDNGPGIPENYHNKIFVIFQRLVERDAMESTGVGLAIVKKILDSRNQQIRVISEPGKGSIFAFTWPKYTKQWTK